MLEGVELTLGEFMAQFHSDDKEEDGQEPIRNPVAEAELYAECFDGEVAIHQRDNAWTCNRISEKKP